MLPQWLTRWAAYLQLCSATDWNQLTLTSDHLTSKIYHCIVLYVINIPKKS